MGMVGESNMVIGCGYDQEKTWNAVLSAELQQRDRAGDEV
jgi:hypothetical protein